MFQDVSGYLLVLRNPLSLLSEVDFYVRSEAQVEDSMAAVAQSKRDAEAAMIRAEADKAVQTRRVG